MRDSRSVITNAVKGIPAEDLAYEMDVSTTRMYEILDRDNPVPRTKQLIRAIGKKSLRGARIIRADFDAMFANILGETCEESNAVDLHKEAFEAVQAFLDNKDSGTKAKELRELIVVANCMLAEINEPAELTPRERIWENAKGRFAVAK